MNVDPRIIADMMTEDPDQFNPPQQPQQPSQSNINRREIFMIQLINMANNGANAPFTAEGYNQIGRSNGFLELMSNPSAWAGLVASKQFAQLAGNLSVNLKKQILTEMVTSISRG
jgi:hypothetical protein